MQIVCEECSTVNQPTEEQLEYVLFENHYFCCEFCGHNLLRRSKKATYRHFEPSELSNNTKFITAGSKGRVTDWGMTETELDLIISKAQHEVAFWQMAVQDAETLKASFKKQSSS